MPGRYNPDKRRAEELAAAMAERARRIKAASAVLDTNKAISDTLTRRNKVDSGLLSRARDLSDQSRSVGSNGLRASRLIKERERLLQDSGYSSAQVRAFRPQLNPQPAMQPMARLRQRRWRSR